MFFVNLPLRYAHRNPQYLDLFIARGIHPEVGLDHLSLDEVPRQWHEETARRLREAGLSCSVHLPFLHLFPGCEDDLILAATRKRLGMAFDTARIYAPKHMIGHAGLTTPNFPDSEKIQHARSIETWTELLRSRPGHPPLYLENTFEKAPARLRALAAALARPETGICFDVGHWHSFAKGSVRNNLRAWLESLAPFIRHLHLHDNDGSGDDHLGLGQGSIPWDDFFGLLAGLGIRPTVTLEPHTPEDFEHSLAFIERHREYFNHLG